LKGVGSTPIAIGGVPDHIHILAPLPKSRSVAEFVKIIKSESSKWIKSLDTYYSLFAWQDGYGAFSVSQSILEATKNYILNQEEHHRMHSFEEEYKALLKAYDIQYDEKYLFSD
jgi:REP element-mobilizing transposase RayT